MGKRKRFCAECGAQNVDLYKNFCQNCYWKHNKLGKLKKERIEVPYCLECGSIKLTSGWTGSNFQEEIPEIIAYAQFNNFDTKPGIMIDINDITSINWMNPNPDFKITYLLTSDLIDQFEPHSEEYTLVVKLLGSSCSTCIKRKTGSGDVIVQFRAKNRSITKNEKDTATTIAFTHAADMTYENPESYINDIIENYGGLDFYFGNNAVAEAFIESIKKQWIGHYEKNYKLVTEDKDEKRVYSVTHLFRLPEVKIGDLVEWDEDLYLVHFISKAGIHLKSVMDLSRELTKDWEEMKPLSPSPKVVQKIVVSEDISANSYLLMDTTSYETEEVRRDRFHSALPVSDEIKLFKWKEKYYLIPEIYKKVSL